MATESQTPLRVNQGTSYQTSGDLPAPKGDIEYGSGRVATVRELVPELGSPRQRILTYNKMVDSDVAVEASLKAAKSWILGAEYYIDPASSDEADVEVSDMVSDNLFLRLTTPLDAVMPDITSCFEYGVSAVEPVWEQGEWVSRRTGANRKNYTLLRKLGPRLAPTIKEFRYDNNGGPVSLLQNAIQADNKVVEKEIKIDKLIIFPFNSKGGNLEGRSVLRSAYTHWTYKHGLYKIDAIQKERHGIGVPVVKLQPGYTTADKLAAHELAKNLRTNEWAHMVLPPGMEVVFAELHGNTVDCIPSIEHHNAMIMLNTLTEFLLAGIDAGGGRATSASQLDMFVKASKWFADYICSCFNQFLIPKMVGYNYRGVTRFPQMKVRRLGDTKDSQQLAAALANLATSKLIQPDEELENWIRARFDMPNFKGSWTDPRVVEQVQKQAQEVQNQNGNKKGTVTNGNKPGNMPKDTQEA